MRVGIVGCGAVAPAHLDALKRVPVEVVAVCDPVEERSARAAAAAGIRRTYREAAELIRLERPDVVHVLAPPRLHKELTIQAMRAGCHVLVEKPMALDLAEAEQMVEASRRFGRMLAPCHNLLFDPATLQARELASTGRLGAIVAAEHVFAIPGPLRERFFTTRWIRELPGGIVHELGPHFVYLLQEFLGTLGVVSAISRETSEASPPTLEFRALFESESGFGSAAVSFSSRPRQGILRIYGTEMTLQVDFRGHVLAKVRSGGGGPARTALAGIDLGAQLAGRTVTATLAGLRRPWHRGHLGLIRRFYQALREGRPPPVTAEDGRAVAAVLDQLWATLDPADGRRAAIKKADSLT